MADIQVTFTMVSGREIRLIERNYKKTLDGAKEDVVAMISSGGAMIFTDGIVNAANVETAFVTYYHGRK